MQLKFAPTMVDVRRFTLEVNDFDAIRISLASPEQIRSWSYGEILKPETINYRTLRPERDGLFCERIFGPTRDWECYCGKYKRVRYKGIVCDKCGVEVAPSNVRRERMGHIELASPVSHIWYVKGVPSRLGLLLDVSPRNLERILYFAQYIITDVNETNRTRVLQRLEKEADGQIAELKEDADGKIGELKARLEENVSDLEMRRDTVADEAENQVSLQTDQLMNKAKEVQEYLESNMGDKADHQVKLSSGEVIAEEGEEISRDTEYRLNEVVQDRLSDIQSENQEDRDDVALMVSAEVEQISYVTQQAVDKIQSELDEKIAQIQAETDEEIAALKKIEERELLSESSYYELKERWGNVFEAAMGAEAVRDLVAKIDLDKMAGELRAEIQQTRSRQRCKKAAKRLRVVEAFRKSGNRPEWMIVEVLPVIPPDLRPMVQLDGGRFATSDLNDLYRRVINRNNRLKRLLELGAPDVIVRNEKRMLQEAVDSLIDNGRRGRAVSRSGKRKLKSLSDMLKGKQGRFRRNLLGKRVDYSGRSVIVTGPDLKLNQCGLPKRMALELFKPFVMRRLVEYNYAHNIKSAKRLVDRLSPEVWDVLEETIKDRPVLLNRAPTLHRLGIQAFEVVLIEGSAIQIHPLSCAAFNADFDGDQMAVHVPLSDMAVREARELMLSSRNLLLPANGEPIVGASKDMVLGCHYMTIEKPGAKGEGKNFSGVDEALLAYDLGAVDLRAKIHLLYQVSEDAHLELLETTVGRVLFNSVLPPEIRFKNQVMDKGTLREVVAECYQQLGQEQTAELVDEIKRLGFSFATKSGATIAVSDIIVPDAKPKIIAETEAQVEEIEKQYRRGLITEDEQYQKTVDLWTQAREDILKAVSEGLDPSESMGAMATSGAIKGGFQPLGQLAGMRGLMADPSGRIIALPIRSNFREGLTALEYFLSTHGARKGLADTALRTADAGYLTRRLVDVAQDVIISEEDCGTRSGIWIDRPSAERMNESFADRIGGRMAAANIVDSQTGEVIVAANEEITGDDVVRIDEAQVEKVFVRSPLTCQSRYGLCQMCYGRDLARGELIRLGQAAGIVAAQSIGEPGTQLTLRTFHTGGIAGTEDITQGLPRVEELFEARVPKGQAVLAEMSGTFDVLHEGDQYTLRVTDSTVVKEEYDIPEGYTLVVEDGAEVEEGTPLAENGEDQVVSSMSGKVFFSEEGTALVRRDEVKEWECEVPPATRLRVEKGDHVTVGMQLTEGTKDPKDVLRLEDRVAVQQYLLEEVQRVYRSQGVSIKDKHIEVIIRQMLRKVMVRTAGDTDLLPGEMIDMFTFEDINQVVLADGGKPATGDTVLLGVTKASLNTESFLAAASFQETTRVLTEAAVKGSRDSLRGLKENVIIGKLIPVGTGFLVREEKRKAQELAVAAEEDVKELVEKLVETI